MHIDVKLVHYCTKVRSSLFSLQVCDLGSDNEEDNDDDGETAAGGRLAHLLQILVPLFPWMYSSNSHML